MAGAPLSVKWQDREIRKILQSGDKPAKKAAVDAINLAVRGEIKLVFRRAAADLHVPQKIVRARTYNSKARYNRPSYVVRTVTWPVNMAALGAKTGFVGRGKNKRAVGLQAGVKGAYKASGAFVAPSPKGRLTAYVREGQSRKPIRPVNLEVHETISKELRGMNKRALKLAMKRHYPKQLKFRLQQAAR